MSARANVAQRSHRPQPARSTLEWQTRALCTEVPADYFPLKGDRQAADDAKQVCALCEVRADCLEHALQHNEFGVWGGTSEQERWEIKRQRRARRVSA